MRIPESWLDSHGNCSPFYVRLETAKVEEITACDGRVKILYEAPQDGFSYGCSPSDVGKVLTQASKFVPAMPEIVAFRQPTRKQRQQNPVWGRFSYFADFGEHHGTAIVLEAQELGAWFKWPKRMTLEDRAELERLVNDGHSFWETRRHFATELTEKTVRNTLLYRSLLHELGHLSDYHQKVLDTRSALDSDQAVAADLYFSRPTSEREAFANRFAEELRLSLLNIGAIPFEPKPGV